MSDEPKGGSPPCLACEMDEAYAGFLPPAELAAALTRLLRLAEAAPPPARDRWRACLKPILAALPEPAGDLPAAAGDVVAEAAALLPRIADDRVHAALKTILSP